LLLIVLLSLAPLRQFLLWGVGSCLFNLPELNHAEHTVILLLLGNEIRGNPLGEKIMSYQEHQCSFGEEKPDSYPAQIM